MASKTPAIGTAQFKLLEKLCKAVSVSGDESEVRKIVLDEVKPHADDVKVDALGNVLVTRRAKRGAKRLRVMLDAHMDEVGFMLVAEDGEGLYQFKVIGGIDERSLPGKQVVIGKDHTPGVIGAKPIHLTTRDERKKSLSADSLRIDLSPSGKAKPGDRGTFAPNFQRNAASIMSKSIDDRIGVATLIELVKSAPSNIDLLAAFTVQEEIGLRGAKVAAQFFKPDLAIAIDSTPANDLPMQIESVPVVSVSVPHRYTHTAMSIARVDDWKNTLALLYAALKGMTMDVLKRY
ncbi:MAG: hypothetical protein HY258_05665 [Chloroflexi bacterium]|nr:hypothetical protein [Chloroflexota bacterium]